MDLSNHEGGNTNNNPTMSSSYVGHVIGHQHQGPQPISTLNPEEEEEEEEGEGEEEEEEEKVVVVVRYRECLKNHAASIGGTALDGCGEFMPNGAEGTIEALQCSACSCHRNFHRKEVMGQMGQMGLLGQAPFGPSGPNRFIIPRGCSPAAHHHMVMPLGAMHASEYNEEVERRSPAMLRKKRFRTKFSQEQKEKMMGFAERVGWRIQRVEESVVQQFCQEVGVKRRVLKILEIGIDGSKFITTLC
ncbi:Zinc-finger homeodomain protein 4 [Ananas comosus]|uniref:Zinc-finger homeodomain protein 4 n=1 Tax=Ananas comosus TaxID=4615 RepID=A0A199UK15_ANACO|nr:Zinc-finger homeodomain protein 4 [Ananas comosus]